MHSWQSVPWPISREITHRDERSTGGRDFKSPSEMALRTDKLWDTHRAQETDFLLAAAATSPACAGDRECTCDQGDVSPAHCNQTLVLLAPETVISTIVLVSQLTTVVHSAASRNTPEPM